MQLLYFLEYYFIFFMIYNVIGWLLEEVVCSIGYRQIVNQGFLKGPYLPVYGCGAMLNLLVLSSIQNPLLIFIGGFLLTSVLEYCTSFLMEEVFHARWWDYSKMPFQLNGRICLPGALAFGALSVVEIKLVQPLLEGYAEGFSQTAIQTAAVITFVVFFADMLYSTYRQFCRKDYYRFPNEEKDHAV